MTEVSKKSKTRVSVTMTKSYVDNLDLLEEEGIYLSRGEAVLEGVRILLKQRGIEPFANNQK